MGGSPQDLSVIFSSRLFLKERDRHRERYWPPLLLLHTGARREEIAARLLSDIGQEDGIWYVDIQADEDRDVTVKNKTSVRRVPIHSKLIELGFLKYVETIKAKHGPKLLLFPTGRLACATVGGSVGKWWGNTLQRLKITGKKALHSFRGTVISRLHGAGGKGETVRALVGHSGVDVHETVYLRVALKTLKDAVEELSFPIMTEDQQR